MFNEHFKKTAVVEDTYMDKRLVTCMLYLKGLFVSGNPCLELPVQLFVLILILEKLWSAAESAERWWLLNTMPPLLLLLHDWVALVPKHFHFAIKPLTADCWIYLAWKLTRYRGTIALPLNAVSSSEWLILSQKADCVGRCLILHTCGNETERLKVVAQYVCPYSVYSVCN